MLNIGLVLCDRDIHSVSNMLSREFQTIILVKCQEGDEESLVQYLCQGQGLMLLQTLCILANKVSQFSQYFKSEGLLPLNKKTKTQTTPQNGGVLKMKGSSF